MTARTDDAVELSVVVPTYQDAQCLALTLRSLTRQTVRPERFEVVVVRDGGSSAGYADAVGAATGLDLRLLEFPRRRGRSAARNEAVRHTRAPLLLFLDADSYASPQLLERHLAHHAVAGQPAVLMGRRDELSLEHVEAVLDGRELTGVPRRRADRSGDLRFPHGEPPGQDWLRAGWALAYTHNISLARHLFDRAGGFDERSGLRWGLEDIELFYRVHRHLGVTGSNFAYDDEARAFHLPHHRNTDRNFADFAANRSLLTGQYHVIEWEFYGLLDVYDSLERIVYYRWAATDCARRSTCRIGPAFDRLADRLPGPRVLWVGTGSTQVDLPPGALTFDYAAPPGPTNHHLVGMDPPIPAGSLDAVVSVDFWRYLRWDDLCRFVNTSGRLAREVHLVSTGDTGSAPLTPGPAVLGYLRRALSDAFATRLTHVDGLGEVLTLRSLTPAARRGPARV
ncbi:glycosyltransferase family 2 protein [Micromonospora echinofusca]|uniref:Glycosyltransferase, GT2 family n=1 Tax=Micromonospora echinofusca TaxID=47858 RepID=A0A1C5GFJ0_MICEH|nr:glycosyltransferase family 2 protein [Micromonospora echinofusca]SCG18517.1 Glycosyltransferase, GT2 family [Micromonospora echinofusca]